MSIAKLPLKHQFMISFVLVLLLSFITTLGIWGAALLVWRQLPVLPANYYEKKLPAVEKYIQEQGVFLLDPARRTALEQVVPGEGMQYQVLDRDGNIRYGTIAGPVVGSGAELIRVLNTNKVTGDPFAATVTRFVPLLANGHLAGAVALRYRLQATAANPGQKYWPGLLILGMGLAPFASFVFFTYWVARSFSRRLNRPVRELITAAQRIRRQDLDFTISYEANNEIGQLSRAFETMRDALRQSLVRQWRVEEERREMIAALTHDLRTPLTIIRGHVEGLLERGGEHPERLEKYLQTINRNTGRVIRLVNEMRAVAEIDAPEFTVNRRPVDIPAYVAEKAASYREMAMAEGTGFTARLDDQRANNRPLALDPDRLAEVLDNLFSNSLRFTPRGGNISWEVNLTETELTMTFCDSGPGFAPEDLPNVFKKFYRGAGESSRSKGHSGLGLYIAKTLVEKHGGTIAAFNAPAGGACVKISIPAVTP
ncbi:sensor histidine kinase [Desulfotomaculum copahuensis]|uniref:sensor histidine kinase n=1 Tax=Desulfotomaculum copahuensis TaxID=1838280 RepID=UPI001372FFD5|nr:HAMP domain-containing sensor histidine kinase [Desulfotomaculum copahuensis]